MLLVGTIIEMGFTKKGSREFWLQVAQIAQLDVRLASERDLAATKSFFCQKCPTNRSFTFQIRTILPQL